MNSIEGRLGFSLILAVLFFFGMFFSSKRRHPNDWTPAHFWKQLFVGSSLLGIAIVLVALFGD